MKILLCMAFTATLFLTGFAVANEPVPFGDLGPAKPFGPALNGMELEAGDSGLAIQAPNFWSCAWQYERPRGFPARPEEPSRFVITLSGASENPKLELRMHLVREDWSGADVYVFPLDGLSDSPVTISATTPIGEPAETSGAGLGPNEPVGHVQFLLKGTGNTPVRLLVESLGVEPVK